MNVNPRQGQLSARRIVPKIRCIAPPPVTPMQRKKRNGQIAKQTPSRARMHLAAFHKFGAHRVRRFLFLVMYVRALARVKQSCKKETEKITAEDAEDAANGASEAAGGDAGGVGVPDAAARIHQTKSPRIGEADISCLHWFGRQECLPVSSGWAEELPKKEASCSCHK